MTTGRGERATGTPNTIYDLSSVLFHALEGGASYDTYIEDAEQEGDQELADFFRRVRDEDSMRADEAQRLLAARTPIGNLPGTEPIREEVPPARTGEAPGTEPIPPAMESTVPPRTEDVPMAEEVPSGTPPQAPPGDVQRELSPEPPPKMGEAATVEQERARRADRDPEDKGLLDKIKDAILGEEERGREGTGRPPRR